MTSKQAHQSRIAGDALLCSFSDLDLGRPEGASDIINNSRCC